jgi:hypothetical protein
MNRRPDDLCSSDTTFQEDHLSMKVADLPLQFSEPKRAAGVEVGGVRFEFAEAHVSTGIVVRKCAEQSRFRTVRTFLDVFLEACQLLADPLFVVFI